MSGSKSVQNGASFPAWPAQKLVPTNNPNKQKKHITKHNTATSHFDHTLCDPARWPGHQFRIIGANNCKKL